VQLSPLDGLGIGSTIVASGKGNAKRWSKDFGGGLNRRVQESPTGRRLQGDF